MFIPPSMMEGSKPEYRPEPFATTPDSSEPVEPQVVHGRSGVAWAIRTFDVSLESPGELRIRLFASLAFLWWVSSADIRRGLFLAPALLWLAYDSIRSWIHLSSPDWHDSIRLDSDRLIRDRDRESDFDGLQYEQICVVKLATTTPKISGPIEVNYHPYDEQTGLLNLTRLRARLLPITVDDASLYDELRRRAFGPPPTRQAKIGLFIWRIYRLGLVVGGIFLYASILGRIGR